VGVGVSTTYTTRLPPAYTRRFGCKELHAAFLQHRADRSGVASTVMIGLPEGEQEFDLAMGRARARKARVGIISDTRGQALSAVERAQRALPKHRPVSIERAAAGGWALT
jgi:hypothetical protein